MSDQHEKIKNFIRCLDAEAFEETIGDLVDLADAAGFSPRDADAAIESMIMDRELLVSWPLSLLDSDCSAGPRNFVEGTSTTADIAAAYRHGPHAAVHRDDGGETWIYDLYVENDCEAVPYDPRPHSIRDEQDYQRDAGCILPFGSILPEEALQISFYFNSEKVLTKFQVAVGLRLT